MRITKTPDLDAELIRLRQELSERTTYLDHLPYLAYTVGVELLINGALRFPFRYVNWTHARAVGALSPQSIIGKTDFSVYKRSSALKAYKDYCTIVETKKPLDKEEILFDQLGREHIFQVSKKPVMNDRGEVDRIDGVSIDITREKELETELSYHQKLTNAAYINSPDGIVQIDVETNLILLANKRFHIMNEYCVELSGFTLSRKAQQFLLGAPGLDYAKVGTVFHVYVTPLATEAEIESLKDLVDFPSYQRLTDAFQLAQQQEYRLVGTSIEGINAHNATPAARRRYLKLCMDGPLSSNLEHLTRTKKVILIRSNHHIVMLRGRKILFGNDRDITQQEIDRRLLLEKTEELASANKKLEQLALHHPVSGLPNRRLLEINASNALHAVQRMQDGPVEVALIYLDMERFKEVNDRYGHDAGDEVLKEIGRRLASTIRRKTDTVAHLGGDEFAILLPDLRKASQLDSLVTKIRRALEEFAFVVDQQPVFLGVSIGTSTGSFQENSALSAAEHFQAILKVADQNMYQDKQKRRPS